MSEAAQIGRLFYMQKQKAIELHMHTLVCL